MAMVHTIACMAQNEESATSLLICISFAIVINMCGALKGGVGCAENVMKMPQLNIHHGWSVPCVSHLVLSVPAGGVSLRGRACC